VNEQAGAITVLGTMDDLGIVDVYGTAGGYLPLGASSGYAAALFDYGLVTVGYASTSGVTSGYLYNSGYVYVESSGRVNEQAGAVTVLGTMDDLGIVDVYGTAGGYLPLGAYAAALFDYGLVKVGYVPTSGTATTGNLTDNGAVVLEHGSSLQVQSGSLSVSGTATAGAVLIDEGVQNGAVTVGSFGTLAGTGTAGAITADNGGTVAPGVTAQEATLFGLAVRPTGQLTATSANFSNGGNLSIAVAGFQPGVNCGQLNLTSGPLAADTSSTVTLDVAGLAGPGTGPIKGLVLCPATQGKFTTVRLVNNPLPLDAQLLPGAKFLGVTFAHVTNYNLSAPSAVTAGQPFVFTIMALDPNGQQATGYTGPVQFSCTDSQTVLPPVTLSNGTATITIMLKTAGSQTITALANGTLQAKSISIVVSPAAASQVVFGQQPPTTVQSGQRFAPALTVLVEDQFGNVVASDNSTIVTLSVAKGNATLGGTLSVKVVNGVATFTNVTVSLVGAPGAGYALQASATTAGTTLTPSTSATFLLAVLQGTAVSDDVDDLNDPATPEERMVAHALVRPATGLPAVSLLGDGIERDALNVCFVRDDWGTPGAELAATLAREIPGTFAVLDGYFARATAPSEDENCGSAGESLMALPPIALLALCGSSDAESPTDRKRRLALDRNADRR
jgi:hypothetical protein